MRIAIVTSGGSGFDYEDYVRGNLLGTENQLLGLSRELVRRGLQVCILRRWSETREDFLNGIWIASFRSGRSKGSLNQTISKMVFSRRIRRFLMTYNPDVILVVDPFTSASAFDMSCPKMLITHVMIPREMIPQRRRRFDKKRIYDWVNRKSQERLYSKSDLIIALNQDIMTFLRGNGYNSVYIPNGVDPSIFKPSQKDEKYILFGGRLEVDKGIDLLIRAFGLLDDDLKEIYSVRIAGFGPERQRLMSLTEQIGLTEKVMFMPWLQSTEFIECLSGCSLFVLPSSYECMPVSILEAMALGKPVIASDIPGPRQIITHGVDGLLFERGSIDDLKRCLDTLLRDKERRRMVGLNARATIEREFTFEAIADQYIKEFDLVVR